MLGFVETHLRPDAILFMDGYTSVRHNRNQLHKNSKCDSGGVGFMITNELLNCLNYDIVDNEHEGILWSMLICKNYRYS